MNKQHPVTYLNQNGLTHNPSARFDLNHMNGYKEDGRSYAITDMNGVTYDDSISFSFPDALSGERGC